MRLLGTSDGLVSQKARASGCGAPVAEARSPGEQPRVPLGAAVPHVEVHHVLGVRALHRDGEGLEGVEGEGDQAPHCVIDGAPQESRLDLKLQQARITSVKSERKRKSIMAVPDY